MWWTVSISHRRVPLAGLAPQIGCLAPRGSCGIVGASDVGTEVTFDELHIMTGACNQKAPIKAFEMYRTASAMPDPGKILQVLDGLWQSKFV
jgi:hypothetical protein